MEVPRVSTDHLVSSFGQGALAPGRISVETGIPGDVVSELDRRGHIVRTEREMLGEAVAMGFDGARRLPATRIKGDAAAA